MDTRCGSALRFRWLKRGNLRRYADDGQVEKPGDAGAPCTGGTGGTGRYCEVQRGEVKRETPLFPHWIEEVEDIKWRENQYLATVQFFESTNNCRLGMCHRKVRLTNARQ